LDAHQRHRRVAQIPDAFTSTWTYVPLFLIFTLDRPSRVPGPLEAVLQQPLVDHAIGVGQEEAVAPSAAPVGTMDVAQAIATTAALVVHARHDLRIVRLLI
jgi:hypothetical protein